jgi:hypothetical protein
MSEEVDPRRLRIGDRLCGADGIPFALVTSEPRSDLNGTWVETDGIPVEFSGGTTAHRVPGRECHQCGKRGPHPEITMRPWFRPNREDDGRVNICAECWSTRA